MIYVDVFFEDASASWVSFLWHRAPSLARAVFPLMQFFEFMRRKNSVILRVWGFRRGDRRLGCLCFWTWFYSCLPCGPVCVWSSLSMLCTFPQWFRRRIAGPFQFLEVSTLWLWLRGSIFCAMALHLQFMIVLFIIWICFLEERLRERKAPR